jgi:hypothetical protein
VCYIDKEACFWGQLFLRFYWRKVVVLHFRLFCYLRFRRGRVSCLVFLLILFSYLCFIVLLKIWLITEKYRPVYRYIRTGILIQKIFSILLKGGLRSYTINLRYHIRSCYFVSFALLSNVFCFFVIFRKCFLKEQSHEEIGEIRIPMML